MKLIFDFDDTIFDTKRFKYEYFFKCLEKYGISSEKFEESYLAQRKKDKVYDLNTHLSELISKINPPITPNDVISNIKKDMQDYIFPEFKSVSNTYGKDNIFIITHGEINFQQLKIDASRIGDYVARVIIVGGSKQKEIEALCAKYSDEKLFFFDDKFEYVVMDNIPNNLICVFVGDVASLSEEQRSELEKRNIKVCIRGELPQVIQKYAEENKIESIKNLNEGSPKMI